MTKKIENLSYTDYEINTNKILNRRHFSWIVVQLLSCVWLFVIPRNKKFIRDFNKQWNANKLNYLEK